MKKFRLLLCIVLMTMCTCVTAHNSVSRQLMTHAALTRGANDIPSSGIEDLGNKLRLTYVTVMGSYYAGIVMTAEFDGSQSTSKCIKCIQETVSNIPGALEGDETTDLSDDYEGMTKAEVLMAWQRVYGSIIGGGDIDDDDEDDDDDDDTPDDMTFVGSVKDLGNKLVLSFRTWSETAGMWSEGEFTAEFDGSSDDALCIKCESVGRSNVPGEEYFYEDLTEDFKGLTKAQVYIVFQAMLDKIENNNAALGNVDGDSPVVSTYSVSGMRVSEAGQGFSIVRHADGVTEKVMMR